MIQIPQHSERDLSVIVRTVIELCKGHSNAIGKVALRAGATTTVVDAPTCSENSIPILEPLTANAAAEKGNGTMYVTAARGSFTITHANNAQTDRTFGWHVAS